jgi:uncharacterized protein YbjT (DUF2867 family)
MKTFLITDAEGLVGAFTITALLSALVDICPNSPTVASSHKLLTGYHTAATLDAAKAKEYDSPIPIVPVLVDWSQPVTWKASVQDIDGILLLTQFTSQKAVQVTIWMNEICAESKKTSRSIHVVHVGVHTANDVDASSRPPHENWFLDAEESIRHASIGTDVSYTFLRLNFDGYNGVLRPGSISYFLPADKQYGWMAREDIAALAARVLLDGPNTHAGKTYPLSAESLSLSDMAGAATRVMGFEVNATVIEVSDFETMAVQGGPQDDGYRSYVSSVAQMFKGLGNGLYKWHEQTFVHEFKGVMDRTPMKFEKWLFNASPAMKKRLDRTKS